MIKIWKDKIWHCKNVTDFLFEIYMVVMDMHFNGVMDIRTIKTTVFKVLEILLKIGFNRHNYLKNLSV